VGVTRPTDVGLAFILITLRIRSRTAAIFLVPTAILLRVSRSTGVKTGRGGASSILSPSARGITHIVAHNFPIPRDPLLG
jgi:hypothetical protein